LTKQTFSEASFSNFVLKFGCYQTSNFDYTSHSQTWLSDFSLKVHSLTLFQDFIINFILTLFWSQSLSLSASNLHRRWHVQISQHTSLESIYL